MRRITEPRSSGPSLGLSEPWKFRGHPGRLLVMRTAFVALGVAAVLAACGPLGAPGAPTVSATVPPVIGPPISLTGVAKSGVSTKSFTLNGGDYRVDLTIPAPTAECKLVLSLVKEANGPSLDEAFWVFPGGSQSGSLEWDYVPAGTFFLQADRSGSDSCQGAWSATLIPHL
jgi:hypothetical protein